MKVYVVVNLDLCWDNVIGVFDTYEKAHAASRPTPEDLEDPEDREWYLSRLRDRNDPNSIYDMYHIHCKELQ